MPHAQKLYAASWRLTGNVSDAEDLVQETYLKLWTQRDELDKVDNHYAYALRTLKNLFLNMLRQKRIEFSELTPGNDISNEEDEYEITLDEMQPAITQLIERLPQRQRELIMMRHAQGLSYEELQLRTGLSEGNIRTLLCRARQAIRRQMQNINKP